MRQVLLLVALLLTVAALPASADTGTYVIEQYDVALTPHADGNVDIDYHQKWRVTGGSIPWITVGLPNGSFAITASGLAVRTIAPQSQGSWSGVRIDLDRDYQPGQTFEVSFSVRQSKLFYAEGGTYKLDFRPGWYDNAPVEALTIRLKYFVKPESVTADPTPTSKTDAELVWSGMRLGEGERFTIHVSFPKTSAPQAIPEGALRSAGGSGGAEGSEGGGEGDESGAAAGVIILLVIAAVVFFGLILPLISWFSWVAGGRKGRYTGGGIFWGGGWGDSGSGGGGRGTGGGGGFGGSGFSCVCACACVSCACACACAGGGGAGCSRKLQHACAFCERMRGAGEDEA